MKCRWDKRDRVGWEKNVEGRNDKNEEEKMRERRMVEKSRDVIKGKKCVGVCGVGGGNRGVWRVGKSGNEVD